MAQITRPVFLCSSVFEPRHDCLHLERRQGYGEDYSGQAGASPPILVG